MHNCEARNLPLKNLHTLDRQRLRSEFCDSTLITGLFPNDGIGAHCFQVMNRIAEYSRRSLSFDGDILNGFRGVLRAFESPHSLSVIAGEFPYCQASIVQLTRPIVRPADQILI
ncbi:hypothetical protein B0J14DRAFT_277497 [Halenospora varia]|nr:hypothetical protein B0J14DRAFT_277497 [Halenospora varia]